MSRRAEIDPRCAFYLERLYAAHTIDADQLVALQNVAANVGDCAPGTSSFTMIHGPPGTGKTSCIRNLIGALLCHGSVGYGCDDGLDNLCLGDGLRRRPQTTRAIRILVCGQSNTSVDNILFRLHKDGLLDDRLNVYHPQMIRIGKEGHDYGEMTQYSVTEKALPFDYRLFHPEDPERKKPSWRAIQRLGEEVVLTISTVSSCANNIFRRARTGYDVIIIDEAGQLLEMDMFVALVNAVSWARRSGRPLHVVLIGDPRQLPPMSHGLDLMHRYVRSDEFDYKTQVKSAFERLHKNERCTYVMLRTQYRMHPTISTIHSHTFYKGAIVNGLDKSMFEATYKNGIGEGCFAPLTLVDTLQKVAAMDSSRTSWSPI